MMGTTHELLPALWLLRHNCGPLECSTREGHTEEVPGGGDASGRGSGELVRALRSSLCASFTPHTVHLSLGSSLCCSFLLKHLLSFLLKPVTKPTLRRESLKFLFPEQLSPQYEFQIALVPFCEDVMQTDSY